VATLLGIQGLLGSKGAGGRGGGFTRRPHSRRERDPHSYYLCAVTSEDRGKVGTLHVRGKAFIHGGIHAVLQRGKLEVGREDILGIWGGERGWAEVVALHSFGLRF